MTQADLQGAIDRLYAAPLEDFVAERNRVAKELKADGDPGTAERVAKLPKPSAAAWALNHLAREQSAVVEEWAATAAALREASTHATKVGGDAVRAAMASHRDATARLIDVAGRQAKPRGKPLSQAMVDRVWSLLQSATADEDLAELVRAGRVTEEKPPPELAATAKPKPTTKSKRQPSGKTSARGAKPAKRDRQAEAREARRQELEQRVTSTKEEAQRLRSEADDQAATAEAADERLEEARRAVRRSQSEAAAARDAARDAARAAATAERELERLEAKLAKARA